MNVTLIRDGEEEIVPVTLLKPSITILQPIGKLRNTTKKDLEKYNIDYGVKISEFYEDYKSDWYNAGVQEGSIVTKINGKKLFSVDDVQNAVKTRSFNKPLLIEVINKEGEKVVYSFR